MFDLYDPRNAVLPFVRRHPPGEVVAVEGGMGVRAYESVFDFHVFNITDDAGIKQALPRRKRRNRRLALSKPSAACFLVDQLTGGVDERLATSAVKSITVTAPCAIGSSSRSRWPLS